MRLTLRTLLAWLDDTLSPAEVREIGRQVSESPFAKELVEKIHRVTRQRRLTVPPRTGPEAVDPNVVASYLDNELDPDQVSELEKRCLTSDLHLAEVASVHQILSLIGQKAKVPAEARRRMYHLIKGREAVQTHAPRASRQTEPEPVTEPVQPWVTPPPPARPWVERFGPAAAVLALILVLAWSAYKTLTPPQTAPRFVPPVAAQLAGAPAPAAAPAANAPAEAVAANAKGVHADEAEAPGEGPAPDAKAVAVASATGADAEKEARAKGDETGTETEKDKEKAKDKPGGDVPAGAVGLIRKPAGLLLRYNPDRREWERVVDAAGLREQARLLGLAPFRSTIEAGTADVDLVGETEVWANATPPTLAARLTLAQGRVVLHGTTPSLPFEVVFGGKTIRVLPPPGVAVGVERLNRRAPGEPIASPPVVRFFAADGPVTITAGKNEETLDGPGAVTVEPNGTFSDKVATAAPAWVTETEPSEFDKQVGEQFLKSFPPGRAVVAGLVEASESEDKEVAILAASALRAVGDITFIVPLLNKRDTPADPGVRRAVRRAAIAILRAFLAQDPASARALHDQLTGDLGAERAATAEKLLVGYTTKEAKDPATYRKLVQILGTADEGDVGLRELALDNLMTLTGRDDLEYDPENPKPEGRGLRAWRELERAGDLKPVGAAGAPARKAAGK